MLGHLAGGLFIPKLLTRDWRTLSGVDTHTLQKMSRMSETRTPVILVYLINWWWWIIDKSYWAILYTIQQNVEMCVLTPVLCSYAAMYYLQTPSVTQELKHESDHASWRHLYYTIRIWGADLIVCLDSWTIKVHISMFYDTKILLTQDSNWWIFPELKFLRDLTTWVCLENDIWKLPWSLFNMSTLRHLLFVPKKYIWLYYSV